MMFWKVIGCLWVAYMIGSIPTAVWVGKVFHHVDVREHGSGNAGATNTIRVLGPATGIPVLVFDAFKGWIVIVLAWYTNIFTHGSEPFINFQLSLGISAVLGHLFPLFAGFRGGKGVATLFGIVIGLYPIAFAIVALLFLIVFLLTRYVSLGSIFAALSFPFIVIFLLNTTSPSLIMFSILIAVFIPLTHQKNIIRLIRGNESKMKIGKGSNSKK
ncbi:MAG: glycerol-3-phosphate 1-O-acyltransferase PlsY [Bacteroidales bacterium]